MADIEWVTASGTVYPLNAIGSAGASTMQHLGGKRGRFMPPVRASYEPIAANPGQRLVDVQLDARELAIPVALYSTNLAGVRAALRTWAALLDPTAGDGALRVNDVAPSRELPCRYVGGLDGSETWEDQGLYSYKGLLVLRSTSPYWRAIADSTTTFTYTAAGVAFFPFFPLRLGAGVTLSSATVSNGGQVDAWPTFVCTGPFTGLTLRNGTTGRTVATSVTADAGETVTIDTNPLTRSITKGGTNVYSTLTTTDWWPLVPGSNAVTIEGGGGFTAGTQVVATWREQYLTV